MMKPIMRTMRTACLTLQGGKVISQNGLSKYIDKLVALGYCTRVRLIFCAVIYGQACLKRFNHFDLLVLAFALKCYGCPCKDVL